VSLATRGRDALNLGAFILGSFGKSREEIALYIGSIILYFLLYLMLYKPLIYTSIPNWFSPGRGGGYPRSC
jgi:hypothetical protein